MVSNLKTAKTPQGRFYVCSLFSLSNIIFSRIDTFFLCQYNLKYLIDINTTIAIGVAGGNRVLLVYFIQ